MSGYFFQIARQGGARIAGDGGPRARKSTVKRESQLAPIDHEETVMVPPRASSDVPAPKTVKPNTAAVVQDQTRGHRMTHRSTSAIDAATEISPAKANHLTPPERVVEEVKLIEPDSSHVVVSPSPTLEQRKTQTLKPIVIDESAKKTMAHPRTAETPPEKTTEKKFFEKTVEMVEGQTARPAEAHTILLREVQEWIAAAETGSAEVSAGVRDFANPLPDDTRPSERRPGVVRIVEGRRSKAASEVVQEVSTATLSEQNLELSIGTISVIVEGEERQPQSPPAPTARQLGASEPPRRTASLSRHYL